MQNNMSTVHHDHNVYVMQSVGVQAEFMLMTVQLGASYDAAIDS
jgi:hypothetical protein